MSDRFARHGGRTSAARLWAGPASLFGIALAAATVAAVPARAAERTAQFNIPPQPLRDALVAFGLQADVSIGAGDLSGCTPRSRAVFGRLTPAEALSLMLADTGCGFSAVDGRAYRVAPKPRDLAPAPVRAPTPTRPIVEETPVMLLDVVVTATRRPSIANRTPASLSVASGLELAPGRLSTLQDLAPEFAGLTITNLGPGRNKILVRGLSDGAFTGRTQTTVGLYLDDVPITYNAPDPDLRLVDVDRVELLRGPQGSLYGVGSMGGIIRVITRKPNLYEGTVGIAATGALTQSGAPSYGVDALFNAPLIPGKLAVRGVAYSDIAGGYVDDTAFDLKDANRTHRWGGRLAATLAVTPNWELTAGATHQSLEARDSQYAEGGVDRLERSTQVREPHHNYFSQGYATLTGDAGFGQLRVSGSYLVHDFDSRYDASSGLIVFDANSTIRSFNQDDKVRFGVVEAVLASRPAGQLQWLAGVFASQAIEDLNLKLRALDGPGPYNLYDEDRHDRLTETAVYGEVSYSFAPRLTLTLGARAFRAWLDTRSDRSQGVIARDFQGSLKTGGISPKAVLSWQATPTKLVYLQASQGYRMTGFNTTGRVTQQFSAEKTGNQPNRKYRPDTLWAYELGAKATFAERRLEVRSALFYNDWRDIQSDQFLPSGLPYVANVGRGVNIGLEGEAALQAARSLSLRLSFLANAPELRQREDTYPARPSASLPAVPRYSASFAADWRRELRSGVYAVLTGRVAYVGSSILTFQEQDSSDMGNYVTARLSAGLEGPAWRMTLFVDNPTNAAGDTFAFGDPFTQGRVRQFTPLRPRTVGMTLAHNL